jgi:hypothetical protein
VFRSAETTDMHKKKGMIVALHLRALSVELCRKRQVIDFEKKVAELTDDPRLRDVMRKSTERNELISSCFEKLYLGSVWNGIDCSVDSVDFYCVPFARNLQVSCCGCFDRIPGAFDSVIAFNLVSYSDMSFLVLTIFNVVKHYLDSYIQALDLPRNCERLVNDVAFFYCEEPLIAAGLWRSLTEDSKMAIRLSLRHPNFRAETRSPNVIKLTSSDFVTNLTPSMLTRLPIGPNAG